MLLIGSNEIGGGFVRLAFSDAVRRYNPGEALTAAQIKAFHNHRRMIATGRISVYPPQVSISATPAAPSIITHKMREPRHVVSAGFGRFDVFEGRKLNDKSLTRDEADALADRKNS